MAEAATKHQRTEALSEPTKGQKIMKACGEVATMALQTFVTGVSLAAGAHVYNSMAARIGGRTIATITPLRRVV
jgi:hypothetical protein